MICPETTLGGCGHLKKTSVVLSKQNALEKTLKIISSFKKTEFRFKFSKMSYFSRRNKFKY
jgi:hypothetical protein